MTEAAILIATTNTNPDSYVVATTPRLWKPWRVSDKGLSFIAVWESGVLNGVNFQGHLVTDGFILKAYLDNYGIPTVACGHRIIPEDNIHVGQTISLDRAREFKKRDIETAEKRINSSVHVPLFQHEYDALVSIVYNCGSGHGATGLINKTNTGNYSSMRNFIRQYHIGQNQGLIKRRASEANLFSSGVYDAHH